MTELSGSVISVTWAVPLVVAVMRPARPSGAITASSTRMPALVPLSIVTVEYQTVGERPITRAVTASCPGGISPPPVSSASFGQLLALAGVGLRLGELVARLGQLVAQPLVLAPRLEGLVEPVDEVARRLQRPVRGLLEGAEHRRDPALDAVHRPAVALAEVEAEQGQRGDDEQQQHRPCGGAPVFDTCPSPQRSRFGAEWIAPTSDSRPTLAPLPRRVTNVANPLKLTERAHPARNQLRSQLQQQLDGQPDHVRDVAPHLRHQRRAQALDRVGAGPAAPLPGWRGRRRSGGRRARRSARRSRRPAPRASAGAASLQLGAQQRQRRPGPRARGPRAARR